jgi:hypothetical protein
MCAVFVAVGCRVAPSLQPPLPPHPPPPTPHLPTPTPPKKTSAVDTEEFAAALVTKGYARLVIQKGAGEYAPRVLVPPGASAAKLPSGLAVE